MTPDLVNGLFESLGGLFIATSIYDLHKKKHVAGVSPWHAGFFMTWGWWNLIYYPSLCQWLSFAGGLLIVTLNTVWLGMMLYYRGRKQETTT